MGQVVVQLFDRDDVGRRAHCAAGRDRTWSGTFVGEEKALEELTGLISCPHGWESKQGTHGAEPA